MLILLAIVAGILVGAVINVLADDLPMRDNPRLPHYPDGTPRRPLAWLAVLAFLTGQREASPDVPPPPRDEQETDTGDMLVMPNPDTYVPPRPTSRHLTWRHLVVELGTGLAFGALVAAFPHEKNLWAWLVYAAIMMLITVIDVEHRLILFAVIIPSCVFALFVAAVSPEQGKPFNEFLVGGVVGFLVFFSMFLGGVAFAVFSRHEGVAFGFGDVMLATLSGFMIGWRAFIFASLITVFVGAAGAVFYIVIRALLGRGHRWFTPLPYGPYIVIGTLLMLYLREEVQDFIIGGVYY